MISVIRQLNAPLLTFLLSRKPREKKVNNYNNNIDSLQHYNKQQQH